MENGQPLYTICNFSVFSEPAVSDFYANRKPTNKHLLWSKASEVKSDLKCKKKKSPAAPYTGDSLTMGTIGLVNLKGKKV